MAGSIALDTLEGPFGQVSGQLGGSALYFSLAASLISAVALVAPVGREDEARVRALAAGRPLDLAGLSVLDSPTYRWQARLVAGRNLDLGSEDSIYDAWRPSLPRSWAGWAFVGSMRPDRQLEIARALRPAARLLAADAMLSYLAAAPAEVAELLRLCDWFFANEQELAALSGGATDPAAFRRSRQLAGLVLKRGPNGVRAYTEAGELHVPAPPAHVVDTTGAGDALAGAMLADWQRAGGRPEALNAALARGVAAASLAIEAVGLKGLETATPEQLEARLGAVSRTGASPAARRPPEAP